MKTKRFLWAVLLFSGLISKLSAQDFYPTNLTAIIYTDDKNVIKINDNYINHKGFLWLNDSTYAKKDLSALIQLATKNTDKFLEVQVNYYLTNNNLEAFIKRSDSAGLDKIGLDKYEKTYKKNYYKLVIKRGVLFDNRKYNLIAFSQRMEVDTAKNKNAAKKFDYFDNYPFQNSVWYLDTEKIDTRKGNDDKSKYVVTLAPDKITDTKIEFLDDINFKIIFGSAQERQTITGKYNLYSYWRSRGIYANEISFQPKEIPVKTKVKLGYKEPVLEFNYANAPKNTLNYFKYWFKHTSYKVRLENGNRINLTKEVDNNPPVEFSPNHKN
ncbi:MAG: hypothetical protein EOO96_12880 [Pedobacter sp.]|nr:MAG: hypothetical protein EOO96_12880 [Pedobacter sp.]